MLWPVLSSRGKPGRDADVGLKVRPWDVPDGLVHHHVPLQPTGWYWLPRVRAGDWRLPIPVCVANQHRVQPDVRAALWLANHVNPSQMTTEEDPDDEHHTCVVFFLQSHRHKLVVWRRRRQHLQAELHAGADGDRPAVGKRRLPAGAAAPQEGEEVCFQPTSRPPRWSLSQTFVLTRAFCSQGAGGPEGGCLLLERKPGRL